MHISTRNYQFSKGKQLSPCLRERVKIKYLSKLGDKFLSVNVDTKLVSKSLEKCINSILPDMIHLNQNAFVKERGIFDMVMTITVVVKC